MKKLLVTLALAGIAGAGVAGTASAHQVPTPVGNAHINEGGAILVLSGNDSSIDGHIGVEDDGVVAGCNDDNGTAGYQHGEGKPIQDGNAEPPSGPNPCP